jgi:hypothetical protein
MKRREIAGALLTSAAGAALVPNKSEAQACTTPCHARTDAEISAGVTPTNYMHAEVDLRRYGFAGLGSSTSKPDTIAFNSAISVAQQYATSGADTIYGGARITFPQGTNFYPSAGLTWDFNKISVDLNGSTLNFSNLTTGNAIAPLNSITGPNLANLRPLINACHPLMNGYLIGPGVSKTRVSCFYIDDATNSSVSSLKFRNLGVRDFATDIFFGAGAFCTLFESCNFTLTSGRATTYSVIQSGYPGERQTFIDCQWFNKQFLIENSAGASDLFFIGCSFDYFTRAFNCTAGGTISVIGGHIESNTDIDNWAYVSRSDSSIIMADLQLTLTGNKTAYDMFWSDATCTNGGIFIRDCVAAFGPRTFSTHLIGGAGNARVDNLIQNNGSNHPVIARGLNLLAYGGFEQSSYANDWAFSGTTVASRTNAYSRSGTYSLQLPFTANDAPTRAVAKRGCSPGRYIQGEFWYLAPSIEGTGYAFHCETSYLDDAGASLGTTAVMVVTTNVTTWTRQGFKAQTPAPVGTVTAQLLFVANGVTSGTATGYLDDVILNIS